MDEHGGTFEEIEAAINYYLREKGKAGVRRRIRDERRKNVEWWVRIIAPFLAFVTGVLGALIGNALI
jgi:hypothetical protein